MFAIIWSSLIYLSSFEFPWNSLQSCLGLWVQLMDIILYTVVLHNYWLGCPLFKKSRSIAVQTGGYAQVRVCKACPFNPSPQSLWPCLRRRRNSLELGDHFGSHSGASQEQLGWEVVTCDDLTGRCKKHARIIQVWAMLGMFDKIWISGRQNPS